MGYRIQNRRDTADRWAEMNPILLEGEIGLVTNNANQYKIGDGIHAWNDLPLRGFTGTISQELGEDENAVVSQKVVTEKFVEADGKLAELGSEVKMNIFNDKSQALSKLLSTSFSFIGVGNAFAISNPLKLEAGLGYIISVKGTDVVCTRPSGSAYFEVYASESSDVYNTDNRVELHKVPIGEDFTDISIPYEVIGNRKYIYVSFYGTGRIDVEVKSNKSVLSFDNRISLEGFKDFFVISNSILLEKKTDYIISVKGTDVVCTRPSGSAYFVAYASESSDVYNTDNRVELHKVPIGEDFTDISIPYEVIGNRKYIYVSFYGTGRIDVEVKTFLYHDPRDYGAVYDGVTDCAEAINVCLSKGGKTKIIGKGTALCCDSLVFSANNTELIIDDSIIVKLGNNVNKSLLITESGLYNYDNNLAGTNFLKNISIQGGTLDYNGANQTRGTEDKWWGFGTQLADIVNFKFTDIILKNPNSFGFYAGGLHGFVIKNIRFEYDLLRPNMDGIHISGDCRDGLIENIQGVTNDDLVALNVAGDTLSLRRGDGLRITVKDVKCSKSATSNGFRAVRMLTDNVCKLDEIVIENIFGDYRREGVILISSWRGFPAALGNITIKNVQVNSIDGAILWVQNASELGVSIKQLSISNVFHADRDNNIPFIKNEGVIRSLKVFDYSYAPENEEISNENLIIGVGTIEKLFMSFIDINGSGDKTINSLINTKVDKLIISNSYVKAKYLSMTNNESNIIESNNILDVDSITP